MLGMVLSTITFFAASYYLKRYLESMDIPKGATRSALIISIALLIAYVVALLASAVTVSKQRRRDKEIAGGASVIRQPTFMNECVWAPDRPYGKLSIRRTF